MCCIVPALAGSDAAAALVEYRFEGGPSTELYSEQWDYDYEHVGAGYARFDGYVLVDGGLVDGGLASNHVSWSWTGFDPDDHVDIDGLVDFRFFYTDHAGHEFEPIALGWGSSYFHWSFTTDADMEIAQVHEITSQDGPPDFDLYDDGRFVYGSGERVIRPVDASAYGSWYVHKVDGVVRRRSLSAVPLPATLPLVLGAIGALGVLGRLRRRAA